MKKTRFASCKPRHIKLHFLLVELELRPQRPGAAIIRPTEKHLLQRTSDQHPVDPTSYLAYCRPLFCAFLNYEMALNQ